MYLSLYPACALCLTKFLFKRKCPQKHIFFACIWVLLEYIRGFMFTGFPWNLIGYATYNIPFFKQTASIFGIYGVSLVYMLIICLTFVKKSQKYAFFIALCSICYGGYIELLQNDAPQTEENSIDVRIIQPCIEQQNKLNHAMFMNNLNCHLSLSGLEENVRGRKRIVIWPEASINTFIDDSVIRYISSHIKNDNTYVFLGGDRRRNDGEIYNSSVLINKSGTILARYDKKHLLPFGEYIPNFLLSFGLRKVTSGMINFSPGIGDSLIKVDGIPDFGVVICYEAAFPSEIAGTKTQRPKWIINITNDAWFSGSDEIHQHLITTAFRAIEQGVPIFRCANTGVSCVIDRLGKITKKLSENTYGIIKTNTSLPEKETIFSKFGNIPVLVCLFVIMFICMLGRSKMGRKNYSRF